MVRTLLRDLHWGEIEATQAEEAVVMTSTAEVADTVVTAELPCRAIQIYSPIMIPSKVHEKVLVEDVVGSPRAVEVETGATEHSEATKPPVFDLDGDAPTSETKVEVSMVLATEPQVSEAPREESSAVPQDGLEPWSAYR